MFDVNAPGTIITLTLPTVLLLHIAVFITCFIQDRGVNFFFSFPAL